MDRYQSNGDHEEVPNQQLLDLLPQKNNVDHIYLFLKDYTFYRTERVLWYFKHLLSSSSTSCIKFADENVIVLYVQLENGKILDLYRNYEYHLNRYFLNGVLHYRLPTSKTSTATAILGDDNSNENSVSSNNVIVFEKNYKLPFVSIVPKTQISIITSKYKFVFALDISPSLNTVDPISGRVLIDELFSSLQATLLSLSLPLENNHINNLSFTPIIYVSIIAQGIIPEHSRVLIQGAILTRKNVMCLIKDAKEQLNIFENEISRHFQQGYSGLNGVGKTDLSLIFMNSQLALSVLPSGSCPSIVIFTDGVISLPEGEMRQPMENTILTFNRNDISCSIIQIGSGVHLHCNFGYPPDSEILRYLAQNSNGTFIDQSMIPKFPKDLNTANLQTLLSSSFSPELCEKIKQLQHSLLFKEFSPNRTSIPISSSNNNSSLPNNLSAGSLARLNSNSALFNYQQHQQYILSTLNPYPSKSSPQENTAISPEIVINNMFIIQNLMAIDYPFPWIGMPPTIPLLKATAKEYTLEIDILKLLDLRVREGFNVKLVSFKKPESELEVNLNFQFLPNIKLEYRINYHIDKQVGNNSDSNTNDNAIGLIKDKESGGKDHKNQVKVTIAVMAYYEFLKEYTTGISNSLSSSSGGTNSSSSNTSGSHSQSHSHGHKENSGKESSSSKTRQNIHSLQQFLNSINEKDKLLSLIFQQCQPSSVPPPPTSNPIQAHTSQASSFMKMLNNLGDYPWENWLKSENVNVLLKPTIHLNPPLSDGQSSISPSYSISFEASRNSILKFCSKWAHHTFTDRLFVRFLPESASPSFISPPIPPQSQSNGKDNMAHLHMHFPSTSFCILRFQWEMAGFVNINLLFFSTSESIREMTIGSIRSEISQITTPLQTFNVDESFGLEQMSEIYSSPSTIDDYKSLPIYPIQLFPREIKKILVKYEFESILSQLNTNSSSSSSSNTGSNNQLPRPTTPTNKSKPPGLPSLSIPSGSSSNNSSKENINAEKSPPTSARSNSSSSSSSNSLRENSSIISNSNTVHFNSHSFHFHTAIPYLTNPSLKHYLWNRRWVYDLYDSKTCEQVIGFITQERLSEGFNLLNLNTYLFLKEIKLKSLNQIVVTTLQYLVYLRAPNCIVIEIWMEPQRGMFYSQNNPSLKLKEHDLFQNLCKWFEESDLTIISAISSFNDLLSVSLCSDPMNELKSILSPEKRVYLPFKDNSHSVPTKILADKPKLCLDSVILFSTETQKLFPIVNLPYNNTSTNTDNNNNNDTNQPQTKNIINNIAHEISIEIIQKSIQSNIKLYNLLGEILKSFNIIEIPIASLNINNPNSKFKNGGRCYVKGINNSDFVLTYLHPHNLDEYNILTNNPTQNHNVPIDKVLHSLEKKSFIVSFFECSIKGFVDINHSSSTLDYFDRLFSVPNTCDKSKHSNSESKEQFTYTTTNNLYVSNDNALPSNDCVDPLQKYYMKKKSNYHESIHHTTPQHPSTRHYTRNIKSTFERAYLKAIYTNLRDHIPIDTKDLLNSIPNGKEYNLDVEITQFLRILQKSHPNNINSYLNNRFINQVMLMFTKIPGTDYYFYNRPQCSTGKNNNNLDQSGNTTDDSEVSTSTDTLQLDSDSEDITSESNTEEDNPNNNINGSGNLELEGIEKLLEVILGEFKANIDIKSHETGMYPMPLFVRLEFILFHNNPIFQSPNLEGDSNIDLSTSASYQYRFNIDCFPTKDPSFVELSPFKSFIRFRCLTLPPIIPSRVPSLVMNKSLNSYRDRSSGVGGMIPSMVGGNYLSIKNNLPRPLWDLMRSHKKRLISILSQEILDCLRNIRPINEFIIDLVTFHMNKLVNFKSNLHHIHTIDMNLIFIDSKDGAQLFSEQLINHSKMKFKKLNQSFVYYESSSNINLNLPKATTTVIQQTTPHQHQRSSSSSSLTSSIDENSTTLSSSQIWVCNSNELSELKGFMKESSEMKQSLDELESLNDYTIPYWLLLFYHPAQNNLKIQLFSSSVPKQTSPPPVGFQRPLTPTKTLLSTSLPTFQKPPMGDSSTLTQLNTPTEPSSKSVISSPISDPSKRPHLHVNINQTTSSNPNINVPQQSIPSTVSTNPNNNNNLPQPNILNGIDLSSSIDSTNETCSHKYNPYVVQEKLRISIAEVVKRVNQIILLNQLDEMKFCSKFLLPMDVEVPGSSSSGSNPSTSITSPPLNQSANTAKSPFSVSANKQQKHQIPFSSKGSIKSGDSPTDHESYYYSYDRKTGAKSKKPLPFSHGEFTCPLVHMMYLPLNERITPGVAIRGLISTILNPFTISNRKKMFVYRERGGNIFYIKLSEPSQQNSLESPFTSPSPTPSQSPLPSPGTSPPKESFMMNRMMGLQPIQQQSLSSTSTINNQYLILEVFGIDQPGPEITSQLYQLLENKLANLTLSLISSTIMRNPMLKLTPQDIEFIKPPQMLPTVVTIRIPNSLTDPYLYLLLLKQNFIQFLTMLHLANTPTSNSNKLLKSPTETTSTINISPTNININSSEEPNTLQSPTTPTTPLSSTMEIPNPLSKSTSEMPPPSLTPSLQSTQPPSPKEYYEIKSSDFTFLYNFISSTSTQSSLSSIGQGVSYIMVSLLDQNNRPIRYIQQNNCKKNMAACSYQEKNSFLQECLQGVEIIDQENNSLYDTQLEQSPPTSHDEVEWSSNLQLKFWSRGTIVNQLLLDRLVQSINQSLLEYSFECVSIPGISVPISRLNNDYLLPSIQLFSRAKSLATPSVIELKISTPNLASYNIDSFITELNDIITDCNMKLSSTIYFQENSNDEFIKYTPPLTNTNNSTTNIQKPSPISSINLLNKNKFKFIIVGGKLFPNEVVDDQSNLNSYTMLENMFCQNECLFYSHIKDIQFTPVNTFWRFCHFLAVVQSNQILIYTYNWSQSKFDQLQMGISRLQSWFNVRRNLLSNVLHQKLGLYNHVTPIVVNATISSFFPEKLTSPIKFNYENIDLIILNPKPPKKTNPLLSTREESSTKLLSNVSPRQKPITTSPPVNTTSQQSPNSASNSTTNLPTTANINNQPIANSNITPNSNSSPLSNNSTKVKKHSTSSFQLIPEFDNLLKDYFPSTKIYDETKLPSITEPLIRYVTQMKNIAHQVEKASEAKTMFSQARSFFIDTDKTPSSQQLETIMKMSRLVHFRCVPFLYDFFNQDNQSNMNSSSNSSIINNSSEQQIISPTLVGITTITPKSPVYSLPKLNYNNSSTNNINLITSPTNVINNNNWKDLIAGQFIDDYIKYMEKVLHSSNIMKEVGNNINTPGIMVNGIQPLRTYLQQTFKGGSLLIKIGFRDLSVTCELFAILQPSISSAATSSKHMSTLFAEEYGRFTHHLHLNSFVYDFHIKQLSHFFRGTHNQMYPPEYFIEMMHSIPRYYHKPPAHAYSHLYESSFSLPVPIKPNELFNYITKNVHAYQISNLNHSGVSPVLHFTINSPGVENISPPTHSNSTNNETPYQWSVVVFNISSQDEQQENSNNNNSNDINLTNSSNNIHLGYSLDYHNNNNKFKLNLQYFIIKTTDSTMFPRVDFVPHHQHHHSQSSLSTQGSNIGNNSINQAHVYHSMTNLISKGPSSSHYATIHPSGGHSVNNEMSPLITSSIGSSSSSSTSTTTPSTSSNQKSIHRHSIELNSNLESGHHAQSFSHMNQHTIEHIDRNQKAMILVEEIVKSKIYKIVSTSSSDYQRDQLWSKMLRGNPYEAPLTPQEFHHFQTFITRQSLTKMDDSLVNPINLFSFMGNVWVGLSSHLVETCGDRIRQLHIDPVHHLFILNSNADQLMLELTWNEKEKMSNAFICRRHDQNNTRERELELDTFELEHASQLVNTLCHYLWKQMLKK